MPVESPNLDDLRFDGIVQDLQRRIPVHAPEWTDHNESDPGIALIQLFAHLAEQVGYRLNRVPEKTHVELLKLLGTRLLPAHAARTRVAFLLDNPSTLVAYRLAQGAQVAASTGDPPPIFETDAELDVVPAHPVVIVTTKNPKLWDVRERPDGTSDDAPAADFESPAATSDWHHVVWDGKDPKLQDMPVDPVPLAPPGSSDKIHLWIGVDFNGDRSAGFRGVRVALTIQLDDDEQPSQAAVECCCDTAAAAGEAYRSVDWLAYYDEDAKDLRPITGRIDDTTDRLARSGTISFEVPGGIGPIPETEFRNLRDEEIPTAVQACTTLARSITDSVTDASIGVFSMAKFHLALTAVTGSAESAAPTPAVPHPLDPALRDPSKVRGWLRIALPAGATRPVLRMVTFNAATVTHATTVRNELLGASDGRPGLTFALANRNVLDGTLVLELQEEADATLPLVAWAVGDLDAAGPFDRVVDLDPEAGVITFGDGHFGRIPPLVPGAGRAVARTYRHGGGAPGNVPAGDVTSMVTAAGGVSGVVNYVAATGGRDAENLEQAKKRARKELSTRSRAVTASDFEWIALQTPTVEVARAHVVPLRSPLTASRPPGASASGGTALATQPCGAAVSTGPAGLDVFTAHGAVSVVVVPRANGPEPTPTPSFLRAVCRHLDDHRLVTTEVCVVPPQYARLCNFTIAVKALPGYTRAELQEIVRTKLAAYFHVLTGGDGGAGFPFGGQIHIAEIAAEIMCAEGVDRLESVTADFVRTRSQALPRQGRLVQCPSGAGEHDRILLGPEETASFEASSFRLSTVT